MAKLKIITEEEPLRKKSRPITEITDRIRTLLSDMLETMRDADGVGLAAPQVGVLRRAVVIEVTEGEVLYLINPEIIETAGEQVGPEGCLSLPGEQGIVRRPNYVKIRALDIDGNEKTYEGMGLLARAMCHEIDHLDGILYPDKAERMISAEELEEGDEN
ncbi:MAG: peptide deformylase [Clostridiales bacterium]|nr:peptide deformylase [Clostridiales bacterium]